MKKDTEKRLRERLAHNEAYLARPEQSRAYASALTYGAEKPSDWLKGEADAIKCENEFLRVLLTN